MIAVETHPQEPVLYLEIIEAASFQYVIHPTFGRSAEWTLRSGHIDPEELGLHLEEVEIASFDCVTHPTY
jgi:hypothetical protein